MERIILLIEQKELDNMEQADKIKEQRRILKEKEEHKRQEEEKKR